MHENDFHGAQPEVRRYLEYLREQLGLNTGQIRVLDFGCGAGRATLDCLQRGYDAVGIDINAGAVAEGQAKLDAAGFNGKQSLFVSGPNGELPFETGAFHFVFSQQVIEHVGDLASMSRELRRVSAPGGYGLHIFQPQYRPIEAHYFMPFVHWLPKNRSRRWAMQALSGLGIGRQPPEHPDAGARERAEIWYRYSIAHTFYRPFSSIVRTLRSTGHDVCLIASNHRKLVHSRALAPLYRWRSPRVALGWIMSTFAAAYVLTRAADPDFQEPMFEMGAWHSEWIMAYDSALHYTVRETNVPA